jgi:hypothetical protein
MEERSLMDLLTALRGGLPATQGYSLLQDVVMGQQQRLDERQARQMGLLDLIGGQAMAGQSYEGATALADAYTPQPGVPPRVSEGIDALYPEQPLPYSASAGAQGLSYGSARPVQSPAYQAPTPSISEQLAMQQDSGALQSAPIVAQAYADSAIAKLGVPNPETGQPLTAGEIISALVTEDSPFQGLDPRVQAVVLQAVQMRLQEAEQGGGPGIQQGQLRQPAQTQTPQLPFESSIRGGLNDENTRWQDVFGMFPGLFG